MRDRVDCARYHQNGFCPCLADRTRLLYLAAEVVDEDHSRWMEYPWLDECLHTDLEMRIDSGTVGEVDLLDEGPYHHNHSVELALVPACCGN